MHAVPAPSPPALAASPHPTATTLTAATTAATRRFKVERYMQVVFGLSAACLFVPVLYQRGGPPAAADVE